MRITIFGLGVGLIGGIIIGFVILGQKVPPEHLATVAIIIAVLTWFGSGADYLGFLRDWLKEKRQEKENRIKEIEDHTSRIFKDVENERSTFWVGLTWIDKIINSRHKGRILQHLYTAKRDLFDLLNDAMNAHKQNEQLQNTLKGMIENEVRNSGRSESLKSTLEMFAIFVMQAMVNRIGTPEWKDIYAAKKSGGESFSVVIDHPNGIYQIDYPEEGTANEVVARLTNLIKDKEVSRLIQQHQTSSKLLGDCDAALEELLSGIGTGGTTLHGACESCTSKYETKEQEKFKSELVEFEKTDIFKRWGSRP